MGKYYKIADMLPVICNLVAIHPDRILQRLDLSAEVLAAEHQGVDIGTYFMIWDAMQHEYGKPDFPLLLGETFAKAPFSPAVFAFSCSRNLTLAFKRLARFKPLMGPFALRVISRCDSLQVQFITASPTVTAPASFTLLELVYFATLARVHTGAHIRPIAASAPVRCQLTESMLECPIEEAESTSITFATSDAKQPLISCNASFWKEIEPSLKQQLQREKAAEGIVEQVQQILLQTLPSADVSVEAIASRLNVSKRTLQRQLHRHDTNFQIVLNDARIMLAQHYLDNTELNPNEIAYLLGFNEQTSFYRAFHRWFNMTPAEYKNQRSQT